MELTRDNFIRGVYPYAVKASNQLKEKGINVNPNYIVSHWSHETGYGNNRGSKNYNLAGIYAYPDSPYGLSGKRYDSLDSFVDDYVKVLSNKRYSGINQTSSPTDFARALKAGGYATDPNYAYAGTWDDVNERIEELVTGGGSQTSDNEGLIKKDKAKWWQLQDSEGNPADVTFKDLLVGPTIEVNDDGDIVKKDPYHVGEGGSIKETTLQEDVFDLVKISAYSIAIFIILLFALYIVFVQNTDLDKAIKKKVLG